MRRPILSVLCGMYTEETSDGKGGSRFKLFRRAREEFLLVGRMLNLSLVTVRASHGSHMTLLMHVFMKRELVPLQCALR
jgi:hypothetical protein